MIRSQKGFTLVELLVTMAVFIFVIMITSDAFNVIITQSSKLMKSEESNIEGMIGLEQFRHDIQQGGYGLPHQFPTTAPKYKEAADDPAIKFNGTPNSESTTVVPSAFSSGNNLTGISGGGSAGNIVTGSDYLAIRGSTVGRSSTSQRWTYLRYSSLNPRPKTWPSANENIDHSAWVIVLKRTFSNGNYRNELVVDSEKDNESTSYFSPNYDAAGFAAPNFNPTVPNDIYTIYGIDKDDIRMPFNRSDYFVSRSGSMPDICAPNTGILYKTTLKHDNGGLRYIPIVDCVADMQVVFGWDLKNSGVAGTDGLIDTYSNADGSAVSGEATIAEVQAALADAATIRTSLKLVKVYLLVQNGGKDKNYTSPSTFELFDTGQSTLGSTFTLTSNMINYRWKVYRVVVRPKNLQSNQ